MRMVFVLLLIVSAAAFAQEEPGSAAEVLAEPTTGPCDGPEYHQFDFWLGDWSVTANDQLAGSNRVVSVHGGCAIQENWQGASESGISGSSYNIYDRASGKWHQTWVDASGTLLLLDGGLVGSSMVMSGQRPSQDGGIAQHRITWTPNPDGSVRQLWEASTDDGATWAVLFDGLYTRSTTP